MAVLLGWVPPQRAPSPPALVGGAPLFAPQVAHGVRRELRPRPQLQLPVDATDVVLGGLRADEEPLRDLRVRQALAEQPQHLALPLAQQPVIARPRPPLRAERPQERGRLVGLAHRPERLEL